MARLTDHDQRDAEHALRSEVALVLARYARRMLAQGKAYITEEIAQAVKEGRDLDGLTIGRAAADKVKAEYFTSRKPEPAIETTPTHRRIGTRSSGGSGESPTSGRSNRK